ncbi:GxxExxY protein [Desulfuromusa kysingii]|uniref:GxxExxY protein n=1 Tax=Desulfuromusa kysingii TaxID=37625 RepID=A0A1H3YI46_9BACT|nr:GxxExxY protein [Desulfuromusa kysingii]SEA11260.1 GxxExxY protein [Desulfuromusa kysingii]
MKDKAYHDSIAAVIVSSAYKIGQTLGSGFLERVYENALAIELEEADLRVEKQKQIQVFYHAQVVGDYFADLLVEDDVIVELKAAKCLEAVHLAQCQNYLKATGKKLGLVINFGGEKVAVRRVVNGL